MKQLWLSSLLFYQSAEDNLGLLTDVTFAQWKDEELEREPEAQRRRGVPVVIGNSNGQVECHDSMMYLNLGDGAFSPPYDPKPTRTCQDMNSI